MPAQTYLIATDLSAASRRAARNAAILAARTGAEMVFYCAVPPDAAEDIEQFCDVVRSELRDLAEDAASLTTKTSCYVEIAPDAADAAVKYARKRRADLIVVAPHGLTGWKKLMLGSVTEKLLRRAPAMMLIGRGSWRRAPRTLLLAVDMSPGGARALRIGFDLARELDAGMTAFYVLKPPGLAVRIEEALSSSFAYKTTRARIRKAHEQFAEWVAARTPKGMTVETRVDEGHPAQLIVAAAQKAKADLIVIGTHGKSRTEELFVGGVARAVGAAAPVSVLLVRARPPHKRTKKQKE